MSATKTTYNVGSIGCGSRPIFISNLLHKRHREFNLIAVYDHMESVIEEKKKSSGGISYYSDLDDFFEEDLDLVVIGSMNYLHYDHLSRALDKGIKIFCEKPIVSKEDEVNDLLTTCEKIDKSTLGTGFVLRFSPFYRNIKDIIDSGEIGRVCSVNIQEQLHYGHGAFINQNWRRHKKLSGGHVVEKGIHIVDLLLWYVGDVPKKISTLGSCNHWKPSNALDGETLKKINDDYRLFDKYTVYEKVDPYGDDKDLEDTIAINLQFENVTASIQLTTYAPNSKREFNIVGTLGKIEALWETSSATIKVTRKGFGRKDKRGSPCETRTISRTDIGCHGDGDNYIIDGLADMVKKNKPMKPDFKEALLSTKVAILAEKSMENSEVVTF